jgi:hypothetical protein
MNFKMYLGIVLMLSSVSIGAFSGIAQVPQGQPPGDKASESSSIFVIGKIEYLQSEGGYIVRGDHPYGRVFKIANPNPDLLDPLVSSGDKHVNIEGRLTPGTNILFIETLWGKPYAGKQ